MANMESRTNSALFKRAEQLRRWEESETNREPPTPKSKSRRIQFSDGCVFLSACAAGDKDEVLKLIRQGADIDTPNVDGLTALHQACIDDNLDMVEFLVEHGADINRGDHEGWTPLHATASCGFLSIARYLIEQNADVAAVNNDGELPIDIAETEAMEELLEKETRDRGIDCEAARSHEERQMLADTSRWMDGHDSGSSPLLRPHPRTGATALHVAAAKGYIRVISILIQGGADLNAQDVDGWTPLHASSHWGQREACQILCENLADMEIRNYVGQTCFDVADPDVLRLLEECKKRQAIILRERPEVWNNRGVGIGGGSKTNNSQKRRLKEAAIPSSVSRLPQSEKAALQASSKMADKVLAAAGVTEEEKENSTESGAESPDDLPPAKAVQSAAGQQRAAEFREVPSKPPPSGPPPRPPPSSIDLDLSPPTQVHSTGPAPLAQPESEEDVPSWRRPGSFRTGGRPVSGSSANGNHLVSKSQERDVLSRSVSQPLQTPSGTSSSSSTSQEADVALRRAQSVEPDERNRSEGTGDQTTTATLVLSQPATTNVQTNQTTVRRSFVPPVRDEESETQRKAHAKRVRETRRSTQGVTLEEVKSAEQLAKKKQAEVPSASNSSPNEPEHPPTTPPRSQQQPQAQQTPPTSSTPAGDSKSDLERRPSWRLCVNDANKNKFSLEDLRTKNSAGSGSVNVHAGSGAGVGAAAAAVADTVVTIPLRRTKTPDEEVKESSSAAAATPATIQRRRRPKRRSTGVVQIDMEDIDPSGKDSSSLQPGDSEAQSDDSESLSDRGSNSRQVSRPSSLGSSASDLRDETTSTGGSTSASSHQQHPVAAAAAALASGAITANGEIDYKKLWEDSQLENERLRERLRGTNEELGKCKDQLENAFQLSNARNAMTEAEKRERRALERKLSEMEEELKQLQKLKAENEKLKAENRALTRVVSKLTANVSAQSAQSARVATHLGK